VRKVCVDFGIPSLEWLYSEAGHGKGAPDGVGAVAKRMADAHLAQGGSITNSDDFIQLLHGGKIAFVEKASITIAYY
jgi:heptaprenylglyceryl phosphate synthase